MPSLLSTLTDGKTYHPPYNIIYNNTVNSSSYSLENPIYQDDYTGEDYEGSHPYFQPLPPNLSTTITQFPPKNNPMMSMAVSYLSVFCYWSWKLLL